jgi:hypothetical protein
MERLPDHQCRRCGRSHDEVWQMVDSEGRWAIATVRCQCGHQWTVIHTAPANLALLRRWIVRGCIPAEGPVAAVRGTPWLHYRLEGVSPAFVPAAS